MNNQLCPMPYAPTQAAMHKYPRTYHIEGSRFRSPDETKESIPFHAIGDRYLVIEEKVDGANVAISFSQDGQLLLQSRGHYLTGGPREKHFACFKQWAYTHSTAFWSVLNRRYILYGEWLYAKHTVFYDYLPHYFLEYDLFDVETKQFLSTKARSDLLAPLPLVSVPVLFCGYLQSSQQLEQFLGKSNYISSGHLERLKQACAQQQLDWERTLGQTDCSDRMEGLYIKVEENNIVKARYKYIRASFLASIKQADGHWLDRPIIPNLLRPGVDLFNPKI